jgi:hypothetical protein
VYEAENPNGGVNAMSDFDLFLKGLTTVLSKFFYAVVEVGRQAEEAEREAAAREELAAKKEPAAVVPEKKPEAVEAAPAAAALVKEKAPSAPEVPVEEKAPAPKAAPKAKKAAEAPKTRPAPTKATLKKWREVQERLIPVLREHPEGIRLHELGKAAGMGWQTIVRPLNNLLDEGRVLKLEDPKRYVLVEVAAKAEKADAAPAEPKGAKKPRAAAKGGKAADSSKASAGGGRKRKAGGRKGAKS